MKAILLLIVSITCAISPFLSPEFGGFDPEKYPIPQYDPVVQPAGWAFSIWGIIYLALIAHAGFGVARHRYDPAWDKGRWALIVSLAVGSIWLPVALLSPVWATVLIWVMLISVLISLYQTRAATPHWIANLPVALYAGWLSAASFVSIGLLLGGYGVVGEVTAAIIALTLATAFALANQFKLSDWTYGLAVVWGFTGIAAANLNEQMLVTVLAGIAALIVAGFTGIRAIKTLKT